MAKILTVDDSNSIRRMVATTLRSAGHEVEEACDGVDGYVTATSQFFDALLVDVNMPNMDGITMIKRLRAVDTYAHTPMLVLTTESSQERKMAGREAGATGWIVKPFDPDLLLLTLKRILP